MTFDKLTEEMLLNPIVQQGMDYVNYIEEHFPELKIDCIAINHYFAFTIFSSYEMILYMRYDSFEVKSKKLIYQIFDWDLLSNTETTLPSKLPSLSEFHCQLNYLIAGQRKHSIWAKNLTIEDMFT